MRVWDIVGGTEELILRGHTDAVLCVRVNARHVVSSAEDDTLLVWARVSGQRLRVIHCATAHLDFALHAPSSVLLTAEGGRLTVWDLSAHGERLCTLALTDASVPLALSVPAGSSTTSHLLLAGARVVCDLGCLVKTVVLPLPAALPASGSARNAHQKAL